MKTLIMLPAFVLLILAAGCGGGGEAVCRGDSTPYIEIAGASLSDLAADQQLAPEASDEVARRAAESCSSISSAIATNAPAADLALQTTDSVPELREANDRTPVIDQLADDLRGELEEDLVEPLAVAQPTPGSPMLTTLQVIGREAKAHGWGKVTVVWVGDGLVVERSPVTDTPVAFGHGPVDQAVLDEWVDGLEDLRGACVILVGAGADSELDDGVITEAQDMVGKTLAKAGVGFVATRSADLPPGC